MNFKKHILPHLVAVVIFLLLAGVYSHKLLTDNRLQTYAGDAALSSSKVLDDYCAEHGRSVLWNGSIFCGMPAYPVAAAARTDPFAMLYNVLFDPSCVPLNLIFWALLGFYIALCCFRVNPWIAIVGAVAFGLSTQNFILIATGDFAKCLAITLLPPIVGGVHLAFSQQKSWLGMAVTAFFVSLQMLTNDLQIAIYTAFIVVVYCIFEIVAAIRQKTVTHFFKTVGILAIGLICALMISAPTLLTRYEFTTFSGGGEGRAVPLVFAPDESLTLLIPNVKGGVSYGSLPVKSETFAVVNSYFGRQNAERIITHVPTYFGVRPLSSGPTYFGAAVILLSICGMLIVKGRVKWWLSTLYLSTIAIAWCGNMDLLIGFLPNSNPSHYMPVILVIAQFAASLLAALALTQIFNKVTPKAKVVKALKISTLIIVPILLIISVFPQIFGVSNRHRSDDLARYGAEQSEVRMAKMLSSRFPSDPQYSDSKEAFETDLVAAIRTDRAGLVRHDALRSLLIVILTIVAISLIINDLANRKLLVVAIGILIFVDLWLIDKRLLNDADFVPKNQGIVVEKTFADKEILNDPDPHYRVLNLAADPFYDGHTSYYHKSVGGYGRAGMRRYRELQDSLLAGEIETAKYTVSRMLQSRMTIDDVAAVFEAKVACPLLNMLNVKYLEVSPDERPICNRHALGNAWFVDSLQLVVDAEAELAAMRTLNAATTAVVDERFGSLLTGFSPLHDSTATITLTRYLPDSIEYQTVTQTEQLAVFSEIYYPRGWRAAIDGEPVDHFRADYVLRAMRIPAGRHIVTFGFRPALFNLGETISYAGSAVYALLVLGCVIFNYRKRRLKN